MTMGMTWVLSVLVVSCAVLTEQGFLGSPGSSVVDRLLAVLARGLPCSVRAFSRLPPNNYSCVPVPGFPGPIPAPPSITTAASTLPIGFRRKRHNPRNRYTRSCPAIGQGNITQGLATNPADYPVLAIFNFILGAVPIDPLLAGAVIQGIAPAVVQDPALSTGLCPNTVANLFQYTSPTRNTNCWVIQNFQLPIMVNTGCNQNPCAGCDGNGGRSGENGRSTRENICYPRFQVFNVIGFCPTPAPSLAFDTILVPVDCTCRSVQCQWIASG